MIIIISRRDTVIRIFRPVER